MTGWDQSSPSPDQGDLSVSGPVSGHKSEIATKSESHETTQNRRKDQARPDRSRSSRGRPAETDAVPPSPWTTGPTSRAQLELAAKHRLFHSVFPAGERGLNPCTPPGGTEMATEATPGPGSSPATAPTAPVPVFSPGHADQNHQSVPEQTGGPLVQAMPGEELDPGRHELAIPALGPDQEAAGDRQEKGSLHAQNAGTPDGAGGGLSRSCLGPEISGSLHKHSTDDSAMEAAVEPALQQALRPDADADTLSGMAPGRNHAEAPLDPNQAALPRRSRVFCRRVRGEERERANPKGKTRSPIPDSRGSPRALLPDGFAGVGQRIQLVLCQFYDLLFALDVVVPTLP